MAVKRSSMLLFFCFIVTLDHRVIGLRRFKRSDLLTIQLKNIQEESRSNLIANLKERLEQQKKEQLPKDTQFYFYDKNSKLSNLLSLDKTTGDLKIRQTLDRDTICDTHKLCCSSDDISCPLKFLVKVRHSNTLYLVNFTFNLIDRNDNRPQFSRNLMNVHIRENLPPGQKIYLDLARDPDIGLNGIREYKIPDLRNHRKIPFNIQSVTNNGRITQVYLETTERLDREKQAYYIITVEANDGTDSDVLKVNVTVDDENDNSPIFLNDTVRIKLREDEVIGREIARVKAEDGDAGENAMISYSFGSISLMEPFEIGHDDGIIRLRSPLDHERASKYELTIIARDKGRPERSATITAHIEVEDVNDCYPVITVNSESGINNRYEVPENEDKKVIIATITVTDDDDGENGRVNCIFKENGAERNFHLETLGASGAYTLFSDKRFDRESRSLYKVVIECRDEGMDSKTSHKEIDIHVTDKNDNKPVFKQSSYSFQIEENNNIGSEIGSFRAEDNDIGRNGRVTYRLRNQQMQQFFHLTQSGMLKAARQFDREEKENYILTVIAEDAGNPSLSSTASVTVSILDQNDETPTFSDGRSTIHLSVGENVVVNTVILELIATDNDAGNNGRVTFKLMNITNCFKVSQDGKLSVIKSLDRETKSFYRLLVEARDQGRIPKSSTATILIDITDVNDNKPRFIFPTESTAALNISTDLVPGKTITRVVATDLDINENASIRYRIVPHNETLGGASTATKFLSPIHMFVIDEESGELKLNSPLDPKHFSYMLKIEARDCGNPPLSDARILLIKVIPASVNHRKMRFAPRNVPGVVMILVAGLAVLVLIVLLLLILFLANKRFSLNRNRDGYRSGSKDATHPPSYTDIITEQKGGVAMMSPNTALLSTSNTLNSKNQTLISQSQMNTLSKKHVDGSLDQRTLLLKMEELHLAGTLSRRPDKNQSYAHNSYIPTAEMMSKDDTDQSYCQLHVSNIYQTAEPSIKNKENVPCSKGLSQEAYTSLNPSSVTVAATAQSMALNCGDYSKLGNFKCSSGGGYPISDNLCKTTSFTSGPKTLKYPYDSISHV